MSGGKRRLTVRELTVGLRLRPTFRADERVRLDGTLASRIDEIYRAVNVTRDGAEALLSIVLSYEAVFGRLGDEWVPIRDHLAQVLGAPEGEQN